MANFSCLPFELNAVITCFAWASFKTDVRTEQIYTVTTCEGKIFILCHWASCLASLSSLLRLPIQFTSTHLYTCVEMQCESKGSCPRTQHNGPGQVPWPQLDWHNRSSTVCIKTPIGVVVTRMDTLKSGWTHLCLLHNRVCSEYSG